MKLAAYCRVSTDKDEQIESLIHQKEFFVEYAKRNGHELFRLYADEGITGTSLKKREEFKRLLRDAELGLFHMVGSLPECRGKGIGKMLASIGEYVLKTAGMQTASLKTDDFRVPAIKVYLVVGFQPDLSTEDYVQRWDAIFSGIQASK